MGITSLGFIFLLIAVMINIVLAIFVYRNNPESATNKIYVALSSVMSVWLVVNYASIQLVFIGNSLFLIRLSLFFATPLNFLFLLLAKTIPDKKIGFKNTSLVLLTLATLGVMALTLSPLVLSEVHIIDESPEPVTGPAIGVFGVFSIILNLFAIVTLLLRFRKSEGVARQQIKIVMLGVLILFGAIILTVFLPTVLFNSNFFVPLLPFYALIFLGMTSYAIVTYKLFDVEVLVAEALVLIMSIVLGAKLFSYSTLEEFIIDLFTLVALISFGIMLIKNIRKEIEQRKKLEILTVELEGANEKLKELDHMKSEFLSFASHQIKAPLAIIKGFATLIYDGTYGQSSEKVTDAALKIKDSADKMTQLVTDFLNIRKIEEKKIEYKIEKVDGVKLVSEIFEELKLLANNKELDFNFESEIKEIWINVDVQKISQVIQNLIENSIKYTDSGFVRVKLDSKNGNFVFSVSDSGHGISKELLPHLFEEFQRDGKEKQIEGTGLGLFIAHEFVEAHKGKIWAESEGSGRGSSFFFTIPLAS